MINQARLQIQGKPTIRHRSSALDLPFRACPSFLFKAIVVFIAALAALAI